MLGLHALGLGQEPRAREQLVQARGVVLDDGALRRELHLDGLGVHALEQAEVQEGDAAVAEQQEVARVRIAGELPVAVHAAQEEAHHDLADAIALLLGARLTSSKPTPTTNSLTSTRSRDSELTTLGTTMNGCPAKMRASARWFWASSS